MQNYLALTKLYNCDLGIWVLYRCEIAIYLELVPLTFTQDAYSVGIWMSLNITLQPVLFHTYPGCTRNYFYGFISQLDNEGIWLGMHSHHWCQLKLKPKRGSNYWHLCAAMDCKPD